MSGGSHLPFDDDLLQVHLNQAQCALPGSDYYTALGWIHQIIQPENYVEIGIRNGDSLRKVMPSTRCIGIDPAPNLVGEMPPIFQMFAMTSDDFFASHVLSILLQGVTLRVAFIDGLHLWEQALKDFINLESYTDSCSILLLHDSLPLDHVTSERVRTTHFYSGDVWKLTACLKNERPDLRMATIPAGPTGLTLVSNCDPKSRFLVDNFLDLDSKYSPLHYADYLEHPEWIPQLIVNSEASVRNWLNENP